MDAALRRVIDVERLRSMDISKVPREELDVVYNVIKTNMAESVHSSLNDGQTLKSLQGAELAIRVGPHDGLCATGPQPSVLHSPAPPPPLP